jgi:hypothetical protein
MDFYLVLSREVCPRSSQPHGRVVKHPLVTVEGSQLQLFT